MKILPVKESVLFFFLCCLTYSHSLQAADQRVDSFDVIHYTLDLDISNIASQNISGSAELISVAKISNLGLIRLDLASLTVDSVLQDGNKVTHTHADNYLHVHLTPQVAKEDTFTLQVFYNGKPETDPSGFGGFYFTSGYAFNIGVGFQVEPHNYGRAWFPCVDNFIDRSTYSFHIRTIAAHMAYCNGILTDTINNGDGTHTWNWEFEQEIPTYLASVAVGDYTNIHSDVQLHNGLMPVDIGIYPKDTAIAKISFQNLPQGLKAFEEFYGPYRFDRVGYVAIPFTSGAMEHASNIAYPGYAVSGGLAFEYLWAHELSHHWWGDNITCRTAGDMWLNEGWASFSEALFMEAMYGKEAYRKYTLSNHYDVIRYAHWADNGYIALSPVTHDNTYGYHVYNKGADAVNALRYQMGSDSFFKAVRSFQERFAFKDVSSEDLMNHLKPYYPYANDFFNAWIYEPGFTHVAITDYEIKPNTTGFKIENIQLTQRVKETDKLYKNLRSYVTAFDKSWNSVTHNVLLNPNAKVSLDIPFEPEFIAVNMNGEVSDAITRDYDSIYQTGNYNFPEAELTINVTDVPSPALFYVEHHWIGPEHYGAPVGIRFSSQRYWTINGIWPNGFAATAKINYDGRELPSGFSGGYLDNELITTVEDSLVLLYRAWPTDAWVVFSEYELQTGPNRGDKYGFVNITKLTKGEYVLGYKDHKAGITKPGKEEGSLNVYPNPSNGLLNIKLKDEKISSIRIYDRTGKLSLSSTYNHKNNVQSIDTSSLAAGIYVVEVLADGKTYNKEIIVGK